CSVVMVSLLVLGLGCGGGLPLALGVFGQSHAYPRLPRCPGFRHKLLINNTLSRVAPLFGVSETPIGTLRDSAGKAHFCRHGITAGQRRAAASVSLRGSQGRDHRRAPPPDTNRRLACSASSRAERLSPPIHVMPARRN